MNRDRRVPEGRPQPQGKLGRQGPGLGARGQVVLSLGEEGPWLGRLRTQAAGSGEEGLALGTPPPAAWKVGWEWRGRLVSIKMCLPGEPLEAETP